MGWRKGDAVVSSFNKPLRNCRFEECGHNTTRFGLRVYGEKFARLSPAILFSPERTVSEF